MLKPAAKLSQWLIHFIRFMGMLCLLSESCAMTPGLPAEGAQLLQNHAVERAQTIVRNVFSALGYGDIAAGSEVDRFITSMEEFDIDSLPNSLLLPISLLVKLVGRFPLVSRRQLQLLLLTAVVGDLFYKVASGVLTISLDDKEAVPEEKSAVTTEAPELLLLDDQVDPVISGLVFISKSNGSIFSLSRYVNSGMLGSTCEVEMLLLKTVVLALMLVPAPFIKVEHFVLSEATGVGYYFGCTGLARYDPSDGCSWLVYGVFIALVASFMLESPGYYNIYPALWVGGFSTLTLSFFCRSFRSFLYLLLGG